MAPAIVQTEDGVRIAVHDLGGTGRTLLIAHATGFHGRAYSSVARVLSGMTHSVTFDERGHGESGLPPQLDFSWHGFALDVLAVTRSLGLERPIGFGHSCGGAALLLAEEQAPGTFQSIYCFEPIVFPGDDPMLPVADNPFATGARRRREVFDSRDSRSNYSGKPPFSGLDEDALADYVRFGFEDLDDGTVRLLCRGESEALIYERGFSHDAFAHLDEIACPVTIACGELSDIGVELLAPLTERLRRSRLEVLPGLSHTGPLEEGSRAVALSLLRSVVTPPA